MSISSVKDCDQPGDKAGLTVVAVALLSDMDSSHCGQVETRESLKEKSGCCGDVKEVVKNFPPLSLLF